jgi:outer membrane protein OmpA-like peptidoglycan-associated protein
MSAGAAPPDIKGSSDVAWIGRYAESHILMFQQSAFDEVNVLTRKPKSPTRDEADFLKLEGKRTLVAYQAPKERSSLEVYRNFEQKLLGAGFAMVFGCSAEACGVNGAQLTTLAYGRETNNVMSFSTGYFRAPRYGVFRKTEGRNDQIAAIYVGESPSDGPRVAVLAFEAAAMETDRIVVPTAGEMRAALDASGRIALYGVYFDTGQAVVKPDSQPTIDQIVALLKASPQLSLVVAGHTDSTGDYTANLRLSERRAAAVVAALVKAGIAQGRLTAFGAGMAAPAAPNDDDKGRAKNRRVELVKR